jgi:hypothetical protein
MEKHEIVNQILDYLEYRKNECEEEMRHYSENDYDYRYLEGNFDTYDHLIAKLEDDYR